MTAMAGAVTGVLATFVCFLLWPGPVRGSTGMEMTIQSDADPVTLEAGQTSDVNLTLSGSGDQDVKVYVMRQAPSAPQFPTVCYLERAAGTCTSSSHLCQCIAQTPGDFRFRIRKKFSSQDGGQWRFQVCCKQRIDKIITLHVIPPAVTTERSTTAYSNIQNSTTAHVAQARATFIIQSLMPSSIATTHQAAGASGSDVSVSVLIASLAAVVVLVCVTFTAIVWCLLKFYALRQQPVPGLAHPVIAQPEGNLYEEVTDVNFVLSNCTTGDRLVSHQYRHLSDSSPFRRPHFADGHNNHNSDDDVLWVKGSDDSTGARGRQHSTYLTPSQSRA